MIIKANKQIGFIYKNNESIDKIIQNGDVVFERGFLRERTSTTLPITFGGVGKDLKDYRVYGNTKQQILPDGYTQVDYIESSGTQYIDTNYTPAQNDNLELKNVSTPNISGTLFSAGTGDYQLILHNNRYFKYFASGSATDIGSDLIFNNVNMKIEEGSLYVDNVLKGVSTYGGEVNTTLQLFRRANGGNYKACSIGEVIITNKNTLVRDFVPCYRNSDNEVGLYDIVNNVFYTNQGTGVFTYGSVAPTPDAPIEMVSCGDRTKNLLPTNVSDWEQGAIDATTGQNQESTVRIRTKKYYEIENDKDYYISLENNNYRFLNIILYDSNNSYLGQYYSIDSSINGAINLKINIPSSTISNVKYYRAVLRKSSSSSTITPEEISIIKPMIVLGDTKLDYEPYGYKIPVNVRSENLFDKNNITLEKRLDPNGAFYNDAGYYTTSYIEVAPNTQYVKNSPSENAYHRICFYDTNKSFIIASNSNVYTTPSNAKYIRFCGLQTELNNAMYVTGSTVPSKYIPYYNETTNIYLDEPLRGIGEYSDYIDFVNGKVVRNIKEIVLNGTETGARAAETSTYYTFAITSYGSITNKNSAINCLSNMFLPSATSIINTFRIATTSGNLAFTVPLDFVSSYDYNSFKAKLQELYNNGTPVVIIIPLATPTEEDIELPNIPTIDGNNTLNIETEITPSKVYIKYKSNE